jgi:mono/diheme cytochrome c family protein
LKRLRVAIALCCVLFPITAAISETPATDSGLITNPVYEKNCAKCHGKSAEGHLLGGPSLITTKVAAASTEDVQNIIKNGKGHMPKFAGKLTPEEIDLLAKQIKALKNS